MKSNCLLHALRYRLKGYPIYSVIYYEEPWWKHYVWWDAEEGSYKHFTWGRKPGKISEILFIKAIYII